MWQDEWKRWQKELAARDPEALRELEAQSDEEKLEAFAGKMAFGTGGLRSILGMGPARMNVYTVARATEGLSRVILGSDAPKSVAIAYDTRKNSDVFARAAARVFLGNGIRVVLWPEPVPTPLLSYTVRKLGLGWGVVVTASHNPKQYNGYKVYDRRGVQVIPEQAARITEQMEGVDFFGNPDLPLKAGREAGLLTEPTGVMDAYCEALGQMLPEADAMGGADLPLVYSGLYGTGAKPVSRMLRALGFSNLTTVQMEPDSDFGGLYMPNPEDARVYAQAIEAAKSAGAKLLLATDPDCDRVGAAVKTAAGCRLITGNEMGVLLLDFVCRMRRANGTMPERPVAVKTIVTTPMAEKVAAHYGVELRNVLTGFKFIGEQIGLLEKAGEAGRYIFGFEESYGYLSGSFVRDKDAVNASLLICEMFVWYKSQGKTLADALEALYTQYGFYEAKLLSFTFEGSAGFAHMTELLDSLRLSPPAELAGEAVRQVIDYDRDETGLPRSNVLRFILDGSEVVVRPSGTEPKLKIYLTAARESREKSRAMLALLEKRLTDWAK